MANQIQVTTGLRCVNGQYELKSTQKTRQFSQTTAAGGNPGTVDVGTTEETIGFGDVTPGFVEFVNLDTTNYVEIGFSTGVYGIRLLAGGGPALIYVNTGATIYAKANTAACDVQITSVST